VALWIWGCVIAVTSHTFRAFLTPILASLSIAKRRGVQTVEQPSSAVEQ
jgi:hypothetical protein